jgi:hypothetical protein
MSITLSRKEYVELVLFGFPDEYPKNTQQSVRELRSMGYDATETRLNYYIKRRHAGPGTDGGRNLKWYPKDIDAAAKVLAEEGHFTPEAMMNNLLGISYGQRLGALWEAWKALEKEFRGQLSVNPVQDYFVMHVHPPRVARDGWVEFTPCDDVIKGLKGQRRAAKPSGVIPIAVRKDEIEAEDAQRRRDAGRH